MNVRIAIFALVAHLAWNTGFAQNSGLIVGQDTSRRVITTAVPFLSIAPDARSGAMGDAGAAISPDANAIHWNVAKLAFVENDFGFSLAYTPWLAKIIDDMSLSYLSGYYKINKLQAVGFSLRYFDLGEINFTSNTGEPVGDYRPREFQVGGSYSRLLTEQMGVGVSLKFVHSNLTGNVFSSTDDGQAAMSIAADIGWYWNKDLQLFGSPSTLALGATITDIGSKVTYSNEDQKEFIPTNLRLGSALTTSLDPNNRITLALDFNKLMVPTPPVYEMDENGQIVFDTNGNPVIARGKNPDRPLLSGMFGSFADAPDGFPEELREIMISTGVEYWYKQLFAARAGYFYEHTTKGNRKFFTMGLGLRYNVFGIDFAYLVPTQQEHPLAETLRFTLHFDFKSGKPAAIAPEATN
jgi:hypothetical protein